MPKGHGRGKKYVKGQPSSNPTGAGGKDPEKRMLKKFLKEDFRDAIALVTKSTLFDLQNILKDPTTPVDKMVMASAMIKSIKDGNVDQLIRLAEIVIGKPKEQVEHSVANPYEHMTDSQLDHELKKLEAPTQVQQLGPRDVTPETEENITIEVTKREKA